MMIFISLTFIGSGMTLVVNNAILIVGRFIHGIIMGACNTMGPLYCRELSPKEYKGVNAVSMIVCFRLAQFLTFVLGLGLPKPET